MNIRQKSRGQYAATKFSDLSKGLGSDFGSTDVKSRADIATMLLLKNGYVLMPSIYINEVIKLIRSLRELGIEYTMRTIESPTENMMNDKKWRDMYYEFTTVFFEDDRQLPVELSYLSSKTLVNELKERYYKTESKKADDKKNFKLIVPSGDKGFVSFNGMEKWPLKPTDTIIIQK